MFGCSLRPMLRLEPERYATAAGLLADAPFNVLMAKAVLAGRISGDVFVDSPQPTTVYVKHKCGMSWVIGYGEDERFRSELVDMLADPGARTSPEWLQVYPLDWTDLLDPLTAAERLTRWGRTNFWFNRSRFLARFPGNEGLPTVPCTPDLLARFDGSVIPTQFWNTTAEFLDSGTGYFVVDNGEPAAIGFSSYLDETYLEIGVETAPQYRGRGYARAACARMIHHCLENGLIPVWSCRTENEPSYQLAQKLGLEPVLQLPYYELPHSRR
jgi:RimJ/RimL family protein N-acetyltransferase